MRNYQGYIFGRAGFAFHLGLAVPAFGSFTTNKEELVELSAKSQFAIPNRSSAFKFKDFVNEAISELIERGCVKEVLIPPKFINPLHVVQQSGGKCRLILDLSYLNRFIWKQSVRFEDIRTVFDLFQSGYFFLTFDLKSGYHHVEIFPDHRQYLGFSWNFGSVVKYFVFTVLPFGMSSASYIFSKLVRSLVNYWRGLGRRVFTLTLRVSL